MIESFTLLGREISLYYTFWFIGVIAVIICGYFLGKRIKFTFAKSILHVVGAVILGYLLLWGTSWVFGGGKVSGLNYIRIVTFMPAAIWIMAKLLKDSFGTVADFVAPLLGIFHGVTHLGCIFEGCCHGYSSSWGLFSNEADAVCFPIQPIEAVSSIAIGVILMLLFLKGKQQGRLYAWYLFLFGATRFGWEFLRDNEKIWHGISELAFHALAAAVIGLLALIMIMLFIRKEGKSDETH